MIERFTNTRDHRYNIARGATTTVRLRDGERPLRWGLLPPWRGHGGKRGPTVYAATVDTIASTPFLRTARDRRRCLVLADGFYAWRKVGSRKQAYYIHATGPVAFAGIAATNKDDGVESFALIAVAASSLVAPVADTMPAVVDEGWLASSELAPLALERWRVDAVSTYVDDVAHDDVRCIAPLGNPAQGELF